MTTALTIPSWQQAELGQLGQAGLLSGVNPEIIGAIDEAESSGQGGGINSSGYGGFFGLGAGQQYPGGTPSPALLGATDPQSFATQAEIAASAFAQYQNQAGGNPIAAEEIYQSGSASGPTEGSQILAGVLGTSGSGTPATTTSINANPFDLFGIPQTAASSVWGAVEPFLAKAMFVIAGLAIVVFGFTRLASPQTKQAVTEAATEAAAA